MEIAGQGYKGLAHERCDSIEACNINSFEYGVLTSFSNFFKRRSNNMIISKPLRCLGSTSSVVMFKYFWEGYSLLKTQVYDLDVSR